jgi:O-antigen ligase
LFAPLIVLCGSLRKILLAVVVLDIPLQMDTNYGHLEGPAEMGALGGFNVSVTTMALAALYAAWLIECLVRRDHPWRPLGRFVVPLAAYVSFVAFSLVAASNPELSLRELFLLLQMFLLYLYVVATVRTPQEVRFVVTILLCGLLLESVIMIGLSRIGESVEMAGLTGRVDVPLESSDELARIGGTVGSPNNAAAFLSMLLAPAVAMLLTKVNRSCKLLALAGLAFGFVALITTQSRGGWTAAVLSVAIVCIALMRHGRLPLTIPLLLVGIVTVVALVFQDSIAERLAGDDKGSARSRIPLMATAWEIIRDNPILGVGANNYTAELERRARTFPGDWLYTVHNKYLLVWAENGLGGLAAFLWFLTATIVRGWRRWQRRDAIVAPLALGLTAALVGHTVHMQVDLFSERPQVQLLWLVAGLIGAMGRI